MEINSGNNNTKKENVFYLIYIYISFLFFILIVVPSVVIFIFQFFSQVIGGDVTFKTFINNVSHYSYQPVLDCYNRLLYRLTN